VAISGTIALVGASLHNHTTEAVYVFVRKGKAWSQRAESTASNGAGGDLFGESVAISGTTAVVGAVHKNNVRRAAYVFVRRGKCPARSRAPRVRYRRGQCPAPVMPPKH